MRNAGEFLRPLVKFVMGVPALNRVIMVIIWLSGTEPRIGFVLVALGTSVVICCIHAAVRGADRKLTEMALSLGARASPVALCQGGGLHGGEAERRQRVMRKPCGAGHLSNSSRRFPIFENSFFRIPSPVGRSNRRAV